MFSGDEEGHCGSCHDDDEAAYEIAMTIQGYLQTAEGQLEEMEDALEELEHSGRNLSDLQGLTEVARTNLTEVLPITHTLSVERIKEKTADVGESAEKHIEITSTFKAELVHRKTILGGVLVIIVLNIIFIWLKRRSLD
jgi:hypothetical protein